MLTSLDVLAVIIALTATLTLVVTTAIANARLTESRDYWRYQYHELKHFYENEAL
jgi:hypothetical protein